MLIMNSQKFRHTNLCNFFNIVFFVLNKNTTLKISLILYIQLLLDEILFQLSILCQHGNTLDNDYPIQKKFIKHYNVYKIIRSFANYFPTTINFKITETAWSN